MALIWRSRLGSVSSSRHFSPPFPAGLISGRGYCTTSVEKEEIEIGGLSYAAQFKELFLTHGNDRELHL